MAVFKPICIDIYQGDDVSDDPTPLAGLDLVKAQGVAFLIHKASEGPTEQDSRYAARRAKWMSTGTIPVTEVDGSTLSLQPRFGAYHFFHGQDPATEAKNFLAAATLTPNDEAFIDWENVGASGYAPPAAAADAFCCAVEDAIGQSCDVYGGNVPREQLAMSGVSSAIIDRFADRMLWLCGYGGFQPSWMPLPWQSQKYPWLWQDDGDQYGPGPHTMPGIARYCDNSTVIGPVTVRQLYAEWGSASLPTA